MQPKCVQICREDNVATLLHDADGAADVEVVGEAAQGTVRATEPIRAGHKLALLAIQAGDPIVKYGFTIGEATRPIAAGEWVHLHNCRSRHDERSSNLDLQTGVRGETRYE